MEGFPYDAGQRPLQSTIPANQPKIFVYFLSSIYTCRMCSVLVTLPRLSTQVETGLVVVPSRAPPHQWKLPHSHDYRIFTCIKSIFAGCVL
jgi:hypothetical protein